MGFWRRLIGLEAKSTSSTDRPADWFLDWAAGGERTAAGVRVSADTAMRNAAVWACVRVRSEDIGKLPCILYRRLPDGGKERAVDHPLFELVRDRPNPRMTAFEFRQVMQANLDLRGNAYALKEYTPRGELVALWPVSPAYVTVLQTPEGYELFYRIRLPNRPEVILPAEAVLHLRGLSIDGLVGLSPIAYQRETIGLAVAAQKYGAQFFGNNAQPLGGLKVPATLSKEAAGLIRESWKERHQGKRDLAIFDGGLEWVQTGMDNADAQYIEARKFQQSEIWRIYRMPPHKVGDLEQATFSNIEMQALEYVTDCLLSEIVRWEQTLKRDLLSEEDQKTYFFEFLVDSLLRGDLKSRFEAYAIARNWGILSANDCRDRENLNRVENGDVYLQPLNMIEAGTKPPLPKPGEVSNPKALLAFVQTLVALEDMRNA